MQTQFNYYTFIKVCQDTETILAMSNFDSHLEIDKITYNANKTMHIDTIQLSSSLNSVNTTLTFVPSYSEQSKILQNKNLSVQLLCVRIDENNQAKKSILKQGNIGDISIINAMI